MVVLMITLVLASFIIVLRQPIPYDDWVYAKFDEMAEEAREKAWKEFNESCSPHREEGIVFPSSRPSGFERK